MQFFGGLANHRAGAAFSGTDRLEARQILWLYRHDVALLGFVTPYLQRRHPGLIVGHSTQLKASASAAILNQFRHGIGQATSANVMNKGDGVVFTQLPTAVYNFLATPLHFRVLALHRGKVQVFVAGAAGHRRGSTTTQANQHCRATQNHQVSPGAKVALLDMFSPDIAVAPGNHDRLVITANLTAFDTRGLGLKAAEIAAEVGSAKLVVKGGPANRALNHDIQRRHNPVRLAVRHLPGLAVARNIQIGDREAGQPHLGLGAASYRALVADFTTGPGACAGMRRDCGGVIVCLHLHQQVYRLLRKVVFRTIGVGVETPCGMSFNHGRIVRVSRQYALPANGMGIADHLEQGMTLRLTVDSPAGVKNLVPAMLRVGLGKHHQLDIVGVAAQRSKALHQVIDFIIRQSKTEAAIGGHQRVATTGEYVHRAHSRRLGNLKQRRGR